MISYTAAQLRAFNLDFDLPPPRPVRKTLFTLRLWRPARYRRRVATTSPRQGPPGRHTGIRQPSRRSAGPGESKPKRIPVLIGRQKTTARPAYRTPQPRVLVDVPQRTGIVQRPTPLNAVVGPDELTPSLYILNAAALSKPGAIDHLTVDLKSYGISVAIVTETHFKTKHKDSIVSVDGYTVFRRDRVGRRGGGVAVYVSSRLSADVWTCPADSPQFELLWIRVQDQQHSIFIGAIYHPPKPLYQYTALLQYIETSVDALTTAFPTAMIVLAGDFNGLDDADVTTRSALNSIVNQPTRGANCLDRIYVNDSNYAVK